MSVGCAGCGDGAVGNFCATCGRPSATAADLLVVDGADPGALERIRVQRSRLGRYVGVAAVVTLVLLGILVFLGDRGVSDPDDAVATPPSTVPTPEGPLPEAATIDVPTTGVELDGAQPDGVVDTAEPASGQLDAIDPTGGWLGEPVGWYAFIRTARGMVRIDLDTGEREPFWSDLIPLANTGEFAVFRSATVPELAAVPLGEFPQNDEGLPSLFPDPFPSDEDGWVGSDPSAIWRGGIGSSGGWAEVDLQRQQVRRTISGASPDYVDQSPDFVSRAGGLYRLFEGDGTSSGYRRVGDGNLRFHEYGRALIETCDEFLSCSEGWFDSATLQPREDIVPPGDASLRRMEAQGRVAVLSDGSFFDIESGKFLDIPDERNTSLNTDRISVSPDAKVIINSNRFIRTVTNFATGETRQLDGLRASGDSIIFIAKPDR